MNFAEQVDESYGVEEDGLVGDESQVNVPESLFELHRQHYERLCLQINPLSSSENYGMKEWQERLLRPPFPLPQVSITHFSKFFIDDNILQSVKELTPPETRHD